MSRRSPKTLRIHSIYSTILRLLELIYGIPTAPETMEFILIYSQVFELVAIIGVAVASEIT